MYRVEGQRNDNRLLLSGDVIGGDDLAYTIGRLSHTYYRKRRRNIYDKTLCKTIASQLKSKAETIATSIDAVSYRMKIDGHPKNNTFNFYRKYTGTYYFDKNYTGLTYYASPFYELRTTLS